MNYELSIMNYKFLITNYELRITNFKVKTIFRNLLIILCFFCFNNVFSQSVDSLIKEALVNNPYLKSLDLKVRASEERAKSINSYPAPTVGFELSQVPFNTLNWLNEPISQNITFSQMFHLGGKIGAMTDAEKVNIKISRDNIDVYKVNLTGNIKMIFFNIWMLERKIEVQQEGIVLLNQLLTSLTNLFEINKSAPADIFTIKSEIAFNETQLLILSNQKEAEIFKMNKLLGRDLNSPELSVSKALPNIHIEYKQEELENILAGNNPSLKKMNTMAEMNKFEIIANNKDKIPDLMLQAMVMRMPQGMLMTAKSGSSMGKWDGSSDYGYSLMASITLPFAPWTKEKYEAKEQELLANIQSIEAEKNDMQREMNVMLKTALLKLKTSRELIILYSGKVIPLYEQARSSQISQYQNNQTSINMIIDANRMLLMQSMNYYMAQADEQMAIAEIEMMVGRVVNK
ncbi:MAG: hypothetical protein HW421_1532 [Ignavibacteria bacterium]|nr:hypothetical protein [Ignavibacteria bacterium]